jgi:hypothetical protein
LDRLPLKRYYRVWVRRANGEMECVEQMSFRGNRRDTFVQAIELASLLGFCGDGEIMQVEEITSRLR